MAPVDSSVGKRTRRREAGPLGRFSWALFDLANQPFFTLILTFIFAPYFTSVVVGDATRGQALWGYGQAIAGAAIAVLSPFLGSMADAAGPRKPWIFCFQALSAAGCFMLWYALPDTPERTFLVLAAVVVATIGTEFSAVFNNAMLPGLVPDERLGRLSGRAWALGYAGGLVVLIFVLLAFSLPETAMFGLDKTAHEHDRIVGPLTAVWIVVFVTPLFLFTPDAPRSGASRIEAMKQGVTRVIETFRALRSMGNVVLYFVARMTYIDGLFAIFAFGGIYVQAVFGWGTTELGIFGIVITVFSMVGAFAGAWMDDRLGSKPTILIAIVGVVIGAIGIVSLSTDGLPAGRAMVLFAIEVGGPANGSALFATTAERILLGFAAILGMAGGPLQSASRTMVSRLAPPGRIAEFYGLFALSGKVTTFLAPLVVAVVTEASGSRRAGVATIIVFLVAGLLLLLPVREERAAEPTRAG